MWLARADVVDLAEVLDIASITAQLRAAEPDCGWLMLVDGRQKINDCNFAAAAELLGNGTEFTLLYVHCLLTYTI